MNPYKNHTLDELLGMNLDKDVFDRMLEIFEEMQRTALENQHDDLHAILS